MEFGFFWDGRRSHLCLATLICVLLAGVSSAANLPASGGIEWRFESARPDDVGKLERDVPVNQRHRRATGPDGEDAACTVPIVNGFRFVQSGALPAISTSSDGVTVVTFPESASRANVLLEVYGACLQELHVEHLALTESMETCATRIGPFDPDQGMDWNGSSLVRTFSLDLVGDHEPKYSEPYFLCVGRDPALAVQLNTTQVMFVLTSELVPTWLSILLVVLLLMMSGLFSGLNLGLMSLDPMELKVIMQSGSEREKKYARIIQPIRRHGNYLLCTILLGNVVVNATLTNFLDGLTGSGVLAIIASSGGIVIVGEIVPQSVCSRYGLAVGAQTIWITKFFMVLTFPLAFPISWILDRILGEEIGRVFRRAQLMELLKVTIDHHDMAADEMEMLAGVLEFKAKTVEDVMTPKTDMFLLDEDEILDFDTMQKIQKKGHSRIPVHFHGDENDIIGVMFVKDLMFVDPDDKWTVAHMVKLYRHPVLQTDSETRLDVMLEKFKSGVSHMSLVTKVTEVSDRDPMRETIGIVTLEDIIEEIIKSEIVDETDRIRDNRTKEPILRSEESQEMPAEVCGDNYERYISRNLMNAALNFLRTDFERFFGQKVIAYEMLTRLLGNPKVTIVMKLSSMQRNAASFRRRRQFSTVEDDKTGPAEAAAAAMAADDKAAASGAAVSSSLKMPTGHVLYTAGTRCDYFVLVLEGQVNVTLKSFDFERGPFDHFGVDVLETKAPFIPDYTVTALTDLTFVKISLDLYKGACKYSSSPSRAMLAEMSPSSSTIAAHQAASFALGTTIAEIDPVDSDDETSPLSPALVDSPKKSKGSRLKAALAHVRSPKAGDYREMQTEPAASGDGDDETPLSPESMDSPNKSKGSRLKAALGHVRSPKAGDYLEMQTIPVASDAHSRTSPHEEEV